MKTTMKRTVALFHFSLQQHLVQRLGNALEKDETQCLTHPIVDVDDGEGYTCGSAESREQLAGNMEGSVSEQRVSSERKGRQ